MSCDNSPFSERKKKTSPSYDSELIPAVTAVTALTTHGTDQVNGQEDAKNGWRGGGGEALLLEAQGENSSAAKVEDERGHLNRGILRVNKLVFLQEGQLFPLAWDGT